MKKNKKILFITYYFPPLGGVGSIRITKFLKYLPKYGFYGDVIAPKNPPYYFYDDSILKDIPRESKIFFGDFFHPLKFLKRFRKISSRPRGFLLHFVWPDYAIWFIGTALKIFKKIKNNYTTVFISMPPFALGIAGWIIKKISFLSLIIDFRDPWYNNKGIETNFIKKILNRIWEKKVIKVADKITTVTKSFKEELSRRYPTESDKIFYIPNGFDPEEYEERKTKFHKEGIKIGYIGTFSPPKNEGIHMFYALKILNEEKKVKTSLTFIGMVDKKEIEKAKKMGVRKYIKLKGVIKRKDIKRNIRYFDLLWCDYNVNFSPFIVLAKLYEYIGTGIPILLTIDDENQESAEIIKNTGTGIVVKRDGRKIAEILYKNFPSFGKLIKTKEKLKEFSREKITEKLVSLLEEIQ